MRRKLYKCYCCGDWFNTSQDVMVEHLRVRHSAQFEAMISLAAVAVESLARRLPPMKYC